MVVNDPKSVKEVLITKGAHFDARPNFRRFEFLFGGDKENGKFLLNGSIYRALGSSILPVKNFKNYIDSKALKTSKNR